MGIRDLVSRKAKEAKEFVTGKDVEVTDERFPEEARGQLVQMRTERQPSRAAEVVKKSREYFHGQFSPTFKNAVSNKSPAPKLSAQKMQQQRFGNAKENIPRVRVPSAPQSTSFINRQIDLSYKPSQGFTSNVVNRAFSFEEKSKPIFEVAGLPKGGVTGAFESAVGYKPKQKKKTFDTQFTITIKPKKPLPKPL